MLCITDQLELIKDSNLTGTVIIAAIITASDNVTNERLLCDVALRLAHTDDELLYQALEDALKKYQSLVLAKNAQP